MATITSAASGNFSAGATWVGGVVPGAADIAVAATGHTVVIDVNTTVTKVTQAGTGKFTLDDGITLTAEVEANAGTFTSGGTVEVICGAGETAYIVGNVTGVSTTTASICAINVTGVGALELTGDVTGSPGNVTINNFNAAIYTNVSCTIDVTGNVTAGSGTYKHGIVANTSSNADIIITGDVFGANTSFGVYLVGSSAECTVVGDLQGGTNTNGYCIFASGASNVVTVTGQLTGGTGTNANAINSTGASSSVTVTGDVTGGSNATAHGINVTQSTLTVTGNITSTASIGLNMTGGGSITVNGQLVSSATQFAIAAISSTDVLVSEIKSDSNNRWPISARFIRLIDSNTTVVLPTDDAGLVSYVNEDDVNGMPAEADVRDGTVYGALSGLEGTLAVPDPQYVFPGIPTDATVGTGDLIGAVADVTGAQIAAALTAIP